MNRIFFAAVAAVASATAFAQSDERFNPLEVSSTASVSGPVMAAPTAVLFDQGPLTNGVNGTTPISILNGAAPFNYTTLGSTGTAAIRLADDFTVPAGQTWNLQSITVFGYQTGATAASINGSTLRILNAAPPAGTAVFGDQTTNIVPTTTLSGAFRVSDTTLTATNRAIQAIRIPVTVTLTAGTYFIDFTAAGTVASGPFFPPLVPNIATPAPTGNALQFAGTPAAWNPLRMGLVGDPVGTTSGPQQGLPFIVEGTVAGGGTPVTSVPPAGSNVPLSGGTSIIAFNNPGAAPATVTFTIPTGFTVTPSPLTVPAGGAASITVGIAPGTPPGNITGQLVATVAGQPSTYNLSATVAAAQVLTQVNTLSTYGLGLLGLMLAGLGLAAVRRYA